MSPSPPAHLPALSLAKATLTLFSSLLCFVARPCPPQDDNFNNTAGLYDIWLQQIKTSWREVPNNTSAASRLTSELKDLLDRMFDVKQVG